MKAQPARLSDNALLAEVKHLVQHEREATATLIAHLVEFKKRRLHCAEGYSSMFKYCTEVLHLSEHATFLRLNAARMVRRFPVILDALACGDLNLTAIKLLAPHLTPENCTELLAAARHRSKTEIEQFLVRRRPRPDVPAMVRKLPTKPARDAALAELRAEAPPAEIAGTRAAGVPAVEALAVQSPRPVIQPLAADRYKVQFTASATTHAKLRRAQDLLRHRIPDGDIAQVLDLALTALVERLEKQKLAATDRPRASRGSAPGTRTIPASVKRAVVARDDGQCAFVGRNDHRCSETGFLEFHHVVPFARGGPATLSNIQLRCRAHNQFEAILDFGWRETDFVRESGPTWQLGLDRVPSARAIAQRTRAG